MTTYIGALYSIILPAGKRLVMADLRAMAEELGFKGPRTLLATGNLIFEARQQTIATLERKLEEAFSHRFDKHIPMIVRTAEDWLKMAAANPYPKEADADGSLVSVRVQRDRLDPGILEALEPYRAAYEKLAVVDGDLWFAFPGRASTSRLTGQLGPKRLGTGTIRNWNTIRKVADALES
jgi:uncharacterized protein (DUF1697 family)